MRGRRLLGKVVPFLIASHARARAALCDVEQTRVLRESAADAFERVVPDELDGFGGMCTFGQPRRLAMAARSLAVFADLASHGVDKLDFELWSLAVSAVNGCQRCLESHEQVLVKAGASREMVQEAVRIAAVVKSVAVTLEAEDSLA